MTNKKTILVAVLTVLAFAAFAAVSDAAYENSAYIKSNLFPVEQEFDYTNQISVSGGGTVLPGDAALLAVGTPDYPVRPGDIYQLSYFDGSKIIMEGVQIDSNYNAAISNIGTMSAKGLTYLEFKEKVESQVRTFYSYAKPNLTIQSCGVYSVNVAGEVIDSRAVTVWGLTRLSDLAQYATRYASTRDVRVTYEDGQTFTYDLYAASRLGKTIHNPYLEPGCTVTFMKAKATVSISGSVQRPGVYQPQNADNLETLINTYGNGLTNKADSAFYYVSRYVDGELQMFKVASSEAAAFTLQFGDAVYVAEKVNNLKSVLVQGAVNEGMMYYQFYEGETVEYMARSLEQKLAEPADYKNIYVTRNGVVLEKTAVLEEGDIVTVPFLVQYVTVSGGVRNPGKYIYSPGKDVSYYIAQAGGYADGVKKINTKIYNESGAIIPVLEPNCIINVKYSDKTLTNTIAIAASLASLTLQIVQLTGYFKK